MPKDAIPVKEKPIFSPLIKFFFTFTQQTAKARKAAPKPRCTCLGARPMVHIGTCCQVDIQRVTVHERLTMYRVTNEGMSKGFCCLEPIYPLAILALHPRSTNFNSRATDLRLFCSVKGGGLPPITARIIFLQMTLCFGNMIVLSWFQALILAAQSYSASFTPPTARECSCGSEHDQLGMNIWSASNAVCTGGLSCIHGSESHKAELTLLCSSNFDISHPALG